MSKVVYVDFKSGIKVTPEQHQDGNVWDTLTNAQKYRVLRKRIGAKLKEKRDQERGINDETLNDND